MRVKHRRRHRPSRMRGTAWLLARLRRLLNAMYGWPYTAGEGL